MDTGDRAGSSAEVQARVRRFATIRAAQRALEDVAEPEGLEELLALGRRLLRRLRGLSGDGGQAEILDAREALAGVDALLLRLSERIHALLLEAPVPTLCATLAPLAREESGAIRALAAVALQGDLSSQRAVEVVEFLAALLCCEGPPGARVVRHAPLDVLPELAGIADPSVWEAHPDIDEAEQILGRGVRRLDRDDLGATRDRMRSYKRRLGIRLLNPDVLAAAVGYDMAMANRLAEICEDHDSVDALAETIFGAEAAEPVEAPTGARARPLPRVAPPRERAMRSRLFWHAVGALGLSMGLVLLAALLWPRTSVQTLEQVDRISPHLAAAQVSADDGTPRFVGTVAPSWEALSVRERRLEVARIAALLEGEGVHSVTLVNVRRAIQARHEDDTLLWLTAP